VTFFEVDPSAIATVDDRKARRITGLLADPKPEHIAIIFR
jgi:hypothetical protein